MFTNLDYIVLVILVFFVLVSVFKGFLKESISLLSLVIAILISYYLGGYLKDWVSEWVKFEFVVAIICFAITFLFALLLLQNLFNLLFSKIIIDPRIDTLLGVVFGLFKSFLVTGIVFLAIDFVIPTDQPEFIKNSYFKNKFYDIKDTLMGSNNIINNSNYNHFDNK